MSPWQVTVISEKWPWRNRSFIVVWISDFGEVACDMMSEFWYQSTCGEFDIVERDEEDKGSVGEREGEKMGLAMCYSKRDDCLWRG